MGIELPDKIAQKTCPPDKLVILLASLEKKNGPINANYKVMSELSQGEYTVSSLEHFFRDYRNAAKDLLKNNPDVTGEGHVPSPSKKRKKNTDEDDKETATPPKQKSARTRKKAQKANSDDDYDEQKPEKSKVKEETTDT